MKYQILQGDNRETLKTIADNSIDAIITDPPYGIDFLGKAWDANTGALETYAECLRVLKPGGYLLAFSAARTYHHLAITLEQAGFEIRDQIMWLYSSGFPKAQDVGKNLHKKQTGERSYTIPAEDIPKLVRIEGDLYQHPDGYPVRKLPNTKGSGAADQYGGGKWKDTYERVVEVDNPWAGWKTALKPAHEPVAMARKPFKGSTTENVLEWGVGALNIDATRIETDDVIVCGAGNNKTFDKFNAENNIDGPGTGVKINTNVPKWQQAEGGRFPSNVLGEVAGYQKYFYCPKVSRAERHIGFDTNNIPTGNNFGDGLKTGVDIMSKARGNNVGNNHPTVKPVALMRYLIRLVTPPNSTVLDPFCGSGSTGMAAVELGHEFIGCELDPRYVSIAETRIRAWNTPDPTGTTFEELFECK